MSGHWLILASIVAMGVITFILRAFPLIVPKRILTSRYLKSLNVAFPISVMMLLVLDSLGINIHAFMPVEITCKLLALVVVFFSYYFWRNVFISIIIGVASLNLFLYLASLL